MRLIALFCSFYILLLTALPCADVPASCHEHDAPISHSASHQDEGDQCSPFCTCNCCAMSMVCQVEAVDFQVTTIVREQLCSYPTLAVSQRSGEIWQPPQLG